VSPGTLFSSLVNNLVLFIIGFCHRLRDNMQYFVAYKLEDYTFKV
jgi:hypothetical protein